MKTGNSELYNYKDNIALPTREGFIVIGKMEITHLESDANFTRIYSVDKSTLLINKHLKSFESFLPKELFFRAHKRFIVNKSFVTKYIKKDSQFVLSNDVVIPVSVRKKKSLQKEFNVLE